MKTIVLKLRILIFCVVFFSSDVLLSQMLNPQTLSNEWAGYGIGDPYILKFKGKYYLYCSTRDDMTGVKVWSSWDLFNWTYEGSCTTELISKGAYAPEVIYYNGTFYMYTSPGGAGHYVLSSDSPTGPFVVKTGNLGHSIDGNVLIDDDASLIFTHSSGSGIIRNTMSSPLAIDGAEVNTGLALNGWTEGSTLFKRNGLYYLTYTGNHVFSPGYRVAYGMSNSLATTFTAGTNNPVILNTEGAFYGLGHNCNVIGPDLDTWYMGYHNLLGPGVIGPLRKFNLDPMGFNGNKMVVYGPTNWTQPVPALPTFYDRFNRTAIGVNWTNVNGGNWGIYNQELMWQDQIGTAAWYRQLTTQTASSDYTAEFNMKEINRGGNDARFGAVFSYLNESNYGTAVFSSFNNTLEVNYFVNGVSIGPQSFPLLPGWNYQKWHSIRVEKHNSTFKVFIDNMLKSSRTVNGLDGGKIGLATYNDHADFGYTAFSNNSNGSAIFTQYKPVPGVIEAVHFNSGGENIGYHDNTATNIGGAYRNEGVDIRDCPEGGHNIGWNSTGEWYKYNVNIKSTGKYNIGVRYATINTGCQIRVLCDGIDVTGVVNLPTTGGWDAWRTEIIKMASLPAGNHTITFQTVTGEFDFYTLNFKQASTVTAASDNFDSGFSTAWNYSDGNWSVSNGVTTVDGYGKRAMGDIGWTNYITEADIKLSTNGNTGLIFRVQNPANGGANNNSQLGADFFQGYFANILPTGIQLGKFNYNWTELAFFPMPLNINQWYKVRASVEGSTIKIYLDDLTTPKITFTDNNPYLSGKAGVRAYNSTGIIDNFKVFDNSSLAFKLADTSENQTISGSSSLIIPHPVNSHSILQFQNILQEEASLQVFDITGQLLVSKKTHESIFSINRNEFTHSGLYVYKIKLGNKIITGKLLVN